MRPKLKCSISIASYNYERFLPDAVDSALKQSYEPVEVVVVDDGSTDRSLEVLRRYGERIKVVTKTNGGEASSVNAGFRACTGDIVVFLDADDFLYPDALARIVNAFGPGVAKVHYPLDVVDADGHKTGPVMAARLPSGNMTDLLCKFGFYPSPPTSGNAFARSALERILPIPESTFRRHADTYVIAMSALHGDVRALASPCAAWRRHGANMSLGDLRSSRLKLRGDLEVAQFLAGSLNDRQGLRGNIVPSWPQHLRQRLALTKLAPDERIDCQDAVASLTLKYLDAVWQWPAYGTTKRLGATAWVLFFACAPRAWLGGLAADATRLSALTYRLFR